MFWRNRGVQPTQRPARRRRPTATPALHPLEDRTLLSFVGPITYPVGEIPWSVAVADFNGDGIPDLVAANLAEYPAEPGQGVSVLLGNGDGTFGPETRFGTGRNPYAVAVGDFNGDGNYDIAVANYFSGNVSVLLGKGDGTFQASTEYDVGTLPRALAVGDFNGDGVADLAVANYLDGTVSILMGKGDGSFAPAHTVPVGGSPAAVTVADFNGDGLGDLAVTDDEGAVVNVLLGNGDGTFQPAVNYAVGTTPRSVTAADLNGDGIPDLAVVNQDSGSVSVLLGNGDGSFQPAVNYAVGAGPLSVAVADFNGDGVPDLAVANVYETTVSVLMGHGDGTFQGALTFNAGPYPAAVAAGDFNGDGLPDLAIAQGLDPSGMVGILLNQGDWSTAPRPPAHPAPPKHPGQQPPPPQGQTPDNVLVNDPAEDGTSREDTQSETTLAVSGNTVLVAYQDSFTLSLNPPQYDGFSVSTDQGQTFTDGGKLPRTTYSDYGEPALAVDNQTGRVYLVTLSLGPLEVWRSDDNLQTFVATGPVNAAPGRANMDKDALAVDNYSGPGQGNVYVVAHVTGNPNAIYLFRSTDQGDTFGPSGGVQIASGAANPVTGPWVVVGPDHAVYVFWFDGTSSPQSIKMRKSTDQGQTFGPAVTVTTLRTTGASGDLGLGGFRSNAFPQAAVNPVTNQLYVVYDDKGQGADRADVYFQQSDDGGATWGPAVRVVDDTTGADQWQPTIAVTPDGTKVGVFWYDRRLDPAKSLIDRFGSIGQVTADGVAFGPNFRITDTSFAPEFGHDPLLPANYMGDHDQAAADNNNFYVTWGDNRLPSLGHAGHSADVRFARIPAAGPSVLGLVANAKPKKPVKSVRITFDEPINPDTFTPDQVISFTDPDGSPIAVNAVSPVDGSDDTQFDVFFDKQSLPGTYTMTVGPGILDCYGNALAQPFTGTFVIRPRGGHGQPDVDDADILGVLVALAKKPSG